MFHSGVNLMKASWHMADIFFAFYTVTVMQRPDGGLFTNMD